MRAPILVALMQWGDRWLTEHGPPTLLVHEPCGSEIDLGLHCWTCGEDFEPTEITSRPGPGVERGSTERAEPHPPARPAAS